MFNLHLMNVLLISKLISRRWLRRRKVSQRQQSRAVCGQRLLEFPVSSGERQVPARAVNLRKQ